MVSLQCPVSQSARAATVQYRRLGGPNNRHLFLTVLQAGSPRSRCQQIGFPLRALPPSGCVLALGEKARALLSLFLRVPNPSWGSTRMTSSKPNYPPNTSSSPNTIPLGVRASSCECLGDTDIQFATSAFAGTGLLVSFIVMRSDRITDWAPFAAQLTYCPARIRAHCLPPRPLRCCFGIGAVSPVTVKVVCSFANRCLIE